MLTKSEAILAANTARAYPPGLPTEYWGTADCFKVGRDRAVESVCSAPELEAFG